MTKLHQLILSAGLLLISAACSSTPVRFDTAPLAANEEVIGPAEGSSTGIMLFQFIPLGQNDRFAKAYAQALEVSGATRLVDVTIQERWFWAWVLNGYSFRVTGTAVRPKK